MDQVNQLPNSLDIKHNERTVQNFKALLSIFNLTFSSLSDLVSFLFYNFFFLSLFILLNHFSLHKSRWLKLSVHVFLFFSVVHFMCIKFYTTHYPFLCQDNFLLTPVANGDDLLPERLHFFKRIKFISALRKRIFHVKISF